MSYLERTTIHSNDSRLEAQISEVKWHPYVRVLIVIGYFAKIFKHLIKIVHNYGTQSEISLIW